MKRFAFVLLALASAAVVPVVVGAARPHYGGTLRVPVTDEAAARERAGPLVFESLTRVDADAGLRPMLAQSWESDASASRWRIRVRGDVVLHDGTRLEPWHVAAVLRAVERSWKIATDGDQVIVDLTAPAPDLPWALAGQSHAIVVRAANGVAIGTGPFRLDRQSAASWTLRAHESHRDGRPFVDAIEMPIGLSPAAQLADLESGRADIVPIDAPDASRLAQRGLSIVSSNPIELAAVIFEPHRAGDAFAPVRRAFASSLHRASIADVLLQQRAVAATSILPAWLAGYRRPPSAAAPARPGTARTDRLPLVLRVDAADALARAIAERVAVDAREAGFSVSVQAPAGLAPRADARLVRIRLTATTPDRAFNGAMVRSAIRPAIERPVLAVDAVYQAESDVLDRSVVVPIVHLRDLYGVGARVGVWNAAAVLETGEWNFANVWLRSAVP